MTMENEKKKTVKEEILSKIEVSDNGVIPVRSAAATEALLKAQNILDSDYNERTEGEYEKISPDDLDVDNSEDIPDESENVISHTDLIRINGKVYNVVVAKTSNEVLDTLSVGTYRMVKFSCNFSRSDSETIEGNIRDFVPSSANLSRKRINTDNVSGLIVVEPAINGFKVSVFIEELDDASYKEFMDLDNWIRNLQGYAIEKTLLSLHSKGVTEMELVKSQSAVGLVPKYRKLYARGLAEKRTGKAGEKVNKEDRDAAAKFATDLNDELDLRPTTVMTMDMGLQVSVISVTDSPVVAAKWTSYGSQYSYFRKGNVQGRIRRETGSLRSIPILQEDVNYYVGLMESFIPAVLSRFENWARRQVGISQLVSNVALPTVMTPKSKNINDLFNLDPNETWVVGNDLGQKAKKFMDDKLGKQASDRRLSLLEQIVARKQQMDERAKEE